MSTLTPRRAVAEVPYITSVGDRVRALVTDLAVFEKDEHGELALTAVARGEGGDRGAGRAGAGPVPVGAPCGRSGDRARPARPRPVERLRRWDPQGRFLRPGP